MGRRTLNTHGGATILVLSRKLGEKIYVGVGADAICITVVDIQHGKIRLGIEAPKDVPIMREEIRDDPRYQPARHQ